MCFIIYDIDEFRDFKIVEKDILCYKIFEKKEKFFGLIKYYVLVVKGFKYKFGRIYEFEIGIQDNSLIIEEGLYLYIGIFGGIILSWCDLVECIIFKGFMYYENLDYREYVFNKIIIKRVIKLSNV